MTVRILLVEDDRALREALEDSLALSGYSCVAAADAEQALRALNQQVFSLMLSDINMPGMDGQDLLREVNARVPGMPVVLMTAYGDVQGAVQAMREGAVDYLLKPFTAKALQRVLERYAVGLVAADDQPIAEDVSSQQLLALAARVAQSDSTVLLTGESGTGKEVLARYLHQRSPRRQKPFMAINCAAIPENMLEATLFGHEKGAFTGAVTARAGKFEQANGGTLLLDEISEIPLALQAKLLRVLQEREVERVGGRQLIPLDVRVIATSNRDLPQAVAAGEFREDLFYRIAVFPLAWLPLRERVADIVPLANRLLAVHAAKQGRNGVRFAECAQRALLDYAWPGNVRELDNVVQRALILQAGEVLSVDDLGLYGFAPLVGSVSSAAGSVATPNPASVPAGQAVTAAESVESLAQGAGSAEAASVAVVEPLDAMLAAVDAGGLPVRDAGATVQSTGAELEDDVRRHEFRLIAQALQAEQGRRERTAQRLGISPRTLRYKLAQMRELSEFSMLLEG
ncbi:sigma-54 dependent transcriptional regulator [Pseudomonas sp. C27(2019)]|uniref:sigma-54-dependent transcriptional regulator n=1 Tax=Pseudomonas sp. C27(2019) TaxID=2604941 RepID=UPI0021142234|nr:sigma-54 dependent transcriptional regulator [Pseudomonas sp. C27(2019)]